MYAVIAIANGTPRRYGGSEAMLRGVPNKANNSHDVGTGWVVSVTLCAAAAVQLSLSYPVKQATSLLRSRPAGQDSCFCQQLTPGSERRVHCFRVVLPSPFRLTSGPGQSTAFLSLLFSPLFVRFMSSCSLSIPYTP
jgi:hypothetical protein